MRIRSNGQKTTIKDDDRSVTIGPSSGSGSGIEIHGELGPIGAGLETSSQTTRNTDGSTTRTKTTEVFSTMSGIGQEVRGSTVYTDRQTTHPNGQKTTTKTVHEEIKVNGVTKYTGPVFGTIPGTQGTPDPSRSHPTPENSWNREHSRDLVPDDDDSPAPPSQNAERRGPTPPAQTEGIRTQSSDDAGDSFDRDWEPSDQDVRDFRTAHGDRPNVESGDVDPSDVGLPGRNEVPGAYGYGDGPDRLRAERVGEMARRIRRKVARMNVPKAMTMTTATAAASPS